MTDEFKDDPTHGDATNPGLARGRLVLVAVDFSATARHALAWAFDYALHTDATIHTLHVVDRRWSPADLSADPASVQRDVAASEAAAAAELRALTDEARGRLGALHEHVVVGKPADEILRLARQRADLTIRPAPVLSQLAMQVQTTRETVSRTISMLEKRGIIRRDEVGLAVIAEHRLEDLVY